MKGLLNKKQGMSISIILFVLMIIILFTTAITLFYLRDKNFKGDIQSSKSLDETMYKKALLDFYLNQMADATDKTNPVDNFKQQLAKYKLKSGEYPLKEMGEIEKQVDSSHVSTENGQLKLYFTLELNSQIVDSVNSKVGDLAKYSYFFSYPLG